MFYQFLLDLWKGTSDNWYNHGMWYINLVCFFPTKTMVIIIIHFGHYVGKYGQWYAFPCFFCAGINPLQLDVACLIFGLETQYLRIHVVFNKRFHNNKRNAGKIGRIKRTQVWILAVIKRRLTDWSSLSTSVCLRRITDSDMCVHDCRLCVCNVSV